MFERFRSFMNVVLSSLFIIMEAFLSLFFFFTFIIFLLTKTAQKQQKTKIHILVSLYKKSNS